MSRPKVKCKDYEFTIRMIDNGVIMSHHSGMLLAFSTVEEFVAALKDFREGTGVISNSLSRALKDRGMATSRMFQKRLKPQDAMEVVSSNAAQMINKNLGLQAARDAKPGESVPFSAEDIEKRALNLLQRKES